MNKDDLPTQEILDKFFNQSGGSDSSNTLVRHQIESMNEFLDKKLIQIIQGFNSIQVYHNYSQDLKDFKYKINLNIMHPSLTKPVYQTTDGTQMLMTPNLARMNNLTYASNLYVDVHVITDIINDDNVIERKETTIPNVCIGKLPIMVRSKACILTQMPDVTDGECRYDFGAYFIVNGNEKVIICQDRISENKTLIFAPNGNGDGLSAEIRSMPDGMFLPPKTTSLHLSGKPNHMGNVIKLSASFLRSEIPLFIMFRALGIESDKEIYAHILLNIDSKKYQRISAQLAACAEDASDIHTQTDALNYLLKFLGTTGTPKEYLEQPEKAMQIIKNTIRTDFLSHTGSSFRKKALYLGSMVKKLLMIHMGYMEYDNRDSYLHKRIDTPGILYSNLFRQCYGKMIKEVRNLIVRELNLWRANPNIPLQLITTNNVHRFFRQNVIETGLRYALSTGNWGIKSIGSFQNIRQGVAQMYNRMSYLSSLSHLRRINTPMEKNGKLVQPRKLENSQFGVICPNECFAPDTPILLWNGMIKKAEEIVVGDYLIDDNGNPVRVRTTCNGYKTMYEIIPSKKNFMKHTVTDNHILTLKARNHIRNPTGRNKKYTFRYFDKKNLNYTVKSFETKEELESFKSTIDDTIDITIEEYLSLSESIQKQLYIFKSSGINWETKEVALDPYILGMWLGDGRSTGYGFATADKELLDKWIEWGKDNDATIRKGIRYEYHISSTINNTQTGISCNKTEEAPLAKLLRVYNLVKNKHIPKEYLVNDRKTRLALLAGIIDTDGNVRANGHEVRICQGEPNYKIIYDTEFLARSLGFSCHLNDGICTYSVNGEKRKKPYKELTITGEYLYEIPTVLPRKKLNKFENPTSVKKCSSYLQSGFELLKKDVEPFVGWQLEGNGRFLLGDMTTVHNTPEGSAVGLVKNMALSTHITTSISSVYVRKVIEELGTKLYTDEIEDPIEFLNGMGSDTAVRIIINGDIIGYHDDPVDFYYKMKHLKRYGTIPPMTSIVWDIRYSTISISTEAGRMTRPLYIVNNDSHLEILKFIKENPGMINEMTFQKFVAPLVDDTTEGFIEYLDVDEIDKSMIAMFPNDLSRGIKGNSLPPKFTHCEIHPSLLNGVLAGNIPFMDHNQAPRNCYQCLWMEEPVLCSNGTTKPIKNISIGDNVVCFNPVTMIASNTRVIHQYVRPAMKPVYCIYTMSGRAIVATQDHKFITNRGWADLIQFTPDTKMGIYPRAKNIYMDFTDKTEIELNISESKIAFMKSIGWFPLVVGDIRLPILARILGYQISNKMMRFETIADMERYDDDISLIGFKDGHRTHDFIEMMSILRTDDVPEWIMKAPLLIQREFVSGYQSIVNAVMTDNMKIITNRVGEDYYPAYNFNYTLRLASTREYNRYVAYIEGENRSRKDGKVQMIISVEEWIRLIEFKGNLMFIPFSHSLKMRNIMISDITVESDNHSFIGGDGFAVSNSAMGKQAVGVYMTNFNERLDTMAHVLHYPQKPLVYTMLSKYTYSDQMPYGINAIVAIMTHTGFNQEDSVMVNKSAIDRGLFTSTYFKSYRDQCSKNHSTGEEEIFTKPIVEETGRVKPYNYDKLGEDGFIPKNEYVTPSDILVGKIMPYKSQGTTHARDTSLQVKGNDEGHIDYNYTGTNGEGYKFCKVRLRKYRKLMVGDKLACASLDHTILVKNGKFKSFHQLTDDDEVAVLVNGKLVYEKPIEKHYYENFKGKMYHISNQAIDLDVTYNHRMWISKREHIKINNKYKDNWTNYDFEFAENLVGKRVKYKKDAEWDAEDYQFKLPEIKTPNLYFEEKEVDMDAWLIFFGIWIAEGCIGKESYNISIAGHKPRVQKALSDALPKLGHEYKIDKSSNINFSNAQINNYLRQFGKALDKYLPDWAYQLSRRQARILLDGLMLGDGFKSNTHQHYYTSSMKLAESVQCLCLHAGYAADIRKRSEAGSFTTKKDGSIIKTNADGLVVQIHLKRLNPTVNHGHTKEQEIQKEYMYDFEGPVFCLTVSSGVFMIKKNGKPVWTGNSRSAQKGCTGMVYHQSDMPFSKNGITPDIIMNPHAIPSRMTMGQLMECIMGKAGCHIGARGDSTPFTDCSVEDIASVLERSGYERYGNEILYDGRTGMQLNTEIFIGPTYYQRLKHMVSDKIHCLLKDRTVLCIDGWKKIQEIKITDKVAVLKDGKLVYEHPENVLEFPDYDGEMYHISNQAIDLDVTINHKMYVSFFMHERWSEYRLTEASNIIGKEVKYKKDAEWDLQDSTDFGNVEIENSRLPEWCFRLSRKQSQVFIDSLNINFTKLSDELFDDIQRVCIHAGWDILRSDDKTVSIIKNDINPVINGKLSNQKEYTYDYKGPVYCLTVSSGVFMVRHNGKAVWTGNSRGSNGPIVMLTRQPAEGRARAGGLRFGEMERDAIVAHGASTFLKERMLDVSDNFRVFICRKCGLIATANPEKNIYKCTNCKNNADINQVRMPYSMKLLLQELLTMNVAGRIIV